jgi:hypothetical protein
MDASQTVWANRTMIVTASDAPLAREICVAIDGAGGVGMFTTGLSADGLPPATHYISAGFIDEKFANLWPLTTFDPEGVPTTLPGRPVEMTAQAVDAGLIVTVQAVSAMLNATDVTEIEPLVRIAELGLQLSALPEAQPR